MKYYHVSIKKHDIGQILHPQGDSSDKWGIHGIFFSTSPYPHFTTITNGNKSIGFGRKYWIYEVKPLGKVERGMWDDLFCSKGVEIVKEVYNGKKYPEKVSLVERGLRTKLIKKQSHKPKWIVVEKVKYHFQYPKTLRGFKRKDAAEKYAAKVGGIVKERI